LGFIIDIKVAQYLAKAVLSILANGSSSRAIKLYKKLYIAATSHLPLISRLKVSAIK